MVNALKALALLRDAETLPAIEKLAQERPEPARARRGAPRGRGDARRRAAKRLERSATRFW